MSCGADPRNRCLSGPVIKSSLFICLELQKDLFEEGFSYSLQVAATEFRKLRKCKVAKLKGGYSSDASLVFQLWLIDIWIYVIEHCLSQQEAIQLVKDIPLSMLDLMLNIIWA